MLNIDDAKVLLEEALANGVIVKGIDYGTLFIFLVDTHDPFEGQFDPFYSVDKLTGEIRDFSIIGSGNPKVIESLFMKA